MIPLLFILYFFNKYFIIFYFVLNYLLAVLIFLKATNCYFPHMKFTKEETEHYQKIHPEKKHKNQYFHEDFESFGRTELSSISFFWIFYGTLNYFWIKAISAAFCVLMLWFVLRVKFLGRSVKSEFSKEDRVALKKRVTTISGWINKCLGVSAIETDLTHDEKTIKLYRKYLGEDYKPEDHADKYTTIIANHISWMDIVYIGSRIAPSFCAKESVQKIPFIGFCTYAMKTIYIDRTSKENRIQTIKSIEDRQMSVLEGRSFFPVCLYPEGTASNGRTLISFRKGAFYTLTPVKIFIFKIENRLGYFPLSTGGMSILLHMALSLTFKKNFVSVYELPVFAPNDYLFENFSHLGKDKPEIFAEACRHIMSELGDLPLSQSSFETKLNYISEIRRKVVKNT
jgi:1-acyl-sn-glycerol-3-phosphate acyltransferase